ncbi:MAG TPA: DNA mismatch repair endonuclease MutL [Thermoplasmata archaeon]|nr:DNA mismatch repair endonuclease MutL [Thermoplasmata archaeon]
MMETFLPRIRRLDPELIGRIAAGEVVERPASAVKELVENAIDAGATRVTVRLEGGGLSEITVADDGGGIAADELPLALERYATSKLPAGTSLEGIATLGFRGEALAAIAAVSKLTVLTRARGSSEAHGITSEGGSPGATFLAPRSEGTTVTVRELFYNVPARRKFLKGAASEQLEVTAVLDRTHLAQPGVALALEANGQSVLRYAATIDPLEAAQSVFGTEFADHAFRVDLHGDGFAGSGWFSRPPLSRSTSAGIFVSVNGRSVGSRALQQAVRVAFLDYLPRTRHPFGVLNLKISPGGVDVNVHPTKHEVRLARESLIADVVRRAVAQALVGNPQPAETPYGAATAFARPPPEMISLEVPAQVSTAFAPGVRQTFLDVPGSGRVVAAGPRHPEVVLLGCVGALYWVASSGDDLVLIDQHAAAERVVYAELREKGHLARQELVTPVRVELSARQSEALRAHADAVASSGFQVEEWGGNAWRVHAVPTYRGRRARATELPPLLDELADGGRLTVGDAMEDRIAASIACHAAIRAGDPVESEEMGRVLEALYALAGPAATCPHGRPIMLRLDRPKLDRWFGRSGA